MESNIVNIKYTMDKIKIIKKIGPYFPEDFHPVLNKSIVITEKIIKIHELIDFIQVQEQSYIEKSVPIENNKQRLDYISNTIQKELDKENIKYVGKTIETILNMERYKKIFSAVMPIVSNPDILNDPDMIFDLIEIFMDGKGKEEKEKIKEMINMLEIVKNLDA